MLNSPLCPGARGAPDFNWLLHKDEKQTDCKKKKQQLNERLQTEWTINKNADLNVELTVLTIKTQPPHKLSTDLLAQDCFSGWT